MQHPIGQHALLADGRSAALVAPDGNVAWLPWPRVDSPPCLLSLLDDVVGGEFSVAPAEPGAVVVERGYVDQSLVLRTVWRTSTGDLTVADALAWDGPPRLVRVLRARGSVEVVARVRLAPDAARGEAPAHAAATLLSVRDGAGLRVSVRAPGDWTIGADGVAVARFTVADEPCAVVFSDQAHADAPATVDGTVAHFAAALPGPANLTISALATETLGPDTALRLIRQSAAVLLGLRQRAGGIVAAPTTSLPQWPGSGRTWDYRYSWLRDTALAGLAMLRVGLLDDAAGVGDFLGAATRALPPAVLLRVDGSPPPPEKTLNHLRGYRGCVPVRLGNAASEQPQLDVAGEVLEFAAALASNRALPDSLRDGAARVADWTAAHWTEPDHGIWEIRGEPRRYTHSQVMAWAGLTKAAELADAGLLAGDTATWRQGAAAIRRAVLPGDGALQLTDRGGGPDAALSQALLVGMLEARHPRALATLDSIITGLLRNGLVERHDPREDSSSDPCGPFLFPTFWLAEAMRGAGLGGEQVFAAAASARGSTDLFGEVADPADRSPLGNYPQVQSHAGFVLAATG